MNDLANVIMLGRTIQDSHECLSDTCNCNIKNDAYCASYCEHVELVDAYNNSHPAHICMITALLIVPVVLLGIVIWWCGRG